MDLTFKIGELDCADVQVLLDLHWRAMNAASPPDACHVLALDGLRDPGLTFWSAREDGRLVAVGALNHLSNDHGEVKSMRTGPADTGRGIGAAMLAHIMAEARRRGYRQVSLETGSTADFGPAVRLYERAGFVRCGPFGGYPATDFTIFMTLVL
jgi:putative acetyltransferase